MDHDVDDGGWTYSFSFSPIFSWHGHHIFFNSFVRRRRWIRKRIRFLEAGVALVEDDWSKGAGSGQRSTLYRVDSEETSSTDEMEEIKDLSTLILVLKGSRLDREKLDAVRSFLEHGGSDKQYLPDSVSSTLSIRSTAFSNAAMQVSEINKLLIFHESRRRLLGLLEEADLLPSQTSPMATIFTIPPVVSPAPLDEDLPADSAPSKDRSYFPMLASESAHTQVIADPASPNPISPKTVPPSGFGLNTNRPPSIASSVDADGQVKDKSHPDLQNSDSETSDSASLRIAELTYSAEDHVDEAGDLARKELETKKKKSKRERIKRKTSGLWKGKGKEQDGKA